MEGGVTNSQGWCDAFAQSVPVLGIVAVCPLETCGHAAHDLCSFHQFNSHILDMGDRTLKSEWLGEFLCAHFEYFCFALKKKLFLQLLKFQRQCIHQQQTRRTLILSRTSSQSCSLFRSLVTDFDVRYCGILASRWGCPDAAFPTNKTDPDELRKVHWTMSDRPRDANIEFVYFGLRERVIDIGFAMACVREVSASLVPGLRCERGVCVT